MIEIFQVTATDPTMLNIRLLAFLAHLRLQGYINLLTDAIKLSRETGEVFYAIFVISRKAKPSTTSD